MKLALFFMAALGLASTGPTVQVARPSNHSLKDDLQDFAALIPTDEVLDVIILHLATDEEFQETIEYVQSDDFKNLVKAVDAIPEYIEFLNYLQNAGLDVYSMVNFLHRLLKLNELEVPTHSVSLKALKIPRKSDGLNGLIQDIKAILPLNEIQALYEEKLSSSEEFAAFVGMLNSAKFHKVISTLGANEEFQNLIQRAKDAGIDFDAIADVLSTLFGIRFSNHMTNT